MWTGKGPGVRLILHVLYGWILPERSAAGLYASYISSLLLITTVTTDLLIRASIFFPNQNSLLISDCHHLHILIDTRHCQLLYRPSAHYDVSNHFRQSKNSVMQFKNAPWYRSPPIIPYLPTEWHLFPISFIYFLFSCLRRAVVALKMSFLHFGVNIVLQQSSLQIIYTLYDIVAILTQYIEDVLFHIIIKISAITFFTWKEYV